MKRLSALALVLSAFWLANSGHFEILLLTFGLVSVAGVIWIVKRMETVDGRYEPPVFLTLRLPSYLFWLSREIIKSNIDVIRHIWERDPKISPLVFDTFMVDVDTELCEVMYANSVTLTPGTVIMDIKGRVLEIHALTHGAARGLLQGEMMRRIRRLEGGHE